MGKKYLDTKQNSLESSIQGVWKQAVEDSEEINDAVSSVRMDGRTRSYREHRTKLEAARVKREARRDELDELTPDQMAKKKAYQDKHGGRQHAGSPGEKRALGYGSTDHQGRDLKKTHKPGDKGDYGTAQARSGDAETGKYGKMAYTKRIATSKSGSDPKLADLRRKRDALKKEREKIAASYEPDMELLDTLAEQILFFTDLILETNKNDKSDDGEGLDAVQKDAVKKKFKDRKDKDIDNDGDTDDSDKYLHNRRKTVTKAVSKDEAYEMGTDEYREYLEKLTPGEEVDKEWEQAKEFKVQSMKEALAKVWGLDEIHKPGHEDDDEEEENGKKGKKGKADTGTGKPAAIEIDPTIKASKGY